MRIGFNNRFLFEQAETHTYLTSLKSVYHIAAKAIPESKRVEIVEIQDEKGTSEVNGAQLEHKSKSDSRWSDNKINIKKEPSTGGQEKDKK